MNFNNFKKFTMDDVWPFNEQNSSSVIKLENDPWVFGMENENTMKMGKDVLFSDYNNGSSDCKSEKECMQQLGLSDENGTIWNSATENAMAISKFDAYGYTDMGVHSDQVMNYPKNCKEVSCYPTYSKSLSQNAMFTQPPPPPPPPPIATVTKTKKKRYSLKTKGKTTNNKDNLEDKKDDSELWEAQAAFLGPNLWDKTLPYDSDLKYVDLDEFLSENGMPGDGLASGHLGGPAFGHSTGLGLGGLPTQITKRERSPSPSECMSPDTINPPLSPADSTFSMASSGRDFDPRTRAFSDEELKPQPMIKKSRKQFVPDDLKDDKYWARRRKNNMAAKRSRDARRMKENQIAMRAGYLEKENMGLRQELEILKKENHILREKLSKMTDV